MLTCSKIFKEPLASRKKAIYLPRLAQGPNKFLIQPTNLNFERYVLI